VKTLLRLALVIVVAGLGLCAVGLAVVPQLVQIFNAHTADAKDLPPLPSLAQRSLVFDAAGNQIDIFKAENREPFKLSAVPKPVINAVLAVEDESFYQHKGINAKGLLRALLANVSAGEVTQGGSTITQQVVKNSLLTSAKDADRKILEAAYAVRLEQQMSKNAILERYLNSVYLGNNSYGLQAAAETYFGKNVNQLNMYEGAFLAGLIRNPVGYDPIQSPDRSRARFRQAVQRLADVHLISSATAQKVGETWALPTNLLNTPQTAAPRSYFSEQVRQLLLNDTNILGSTPSERYNKLYRGGLRIYTTLDPRMQQYAQNAVATALPDTGGRFQAAFAAENAKTGAIIAMVGGLGFDKSQVNLATTPRQTGSSAKIFVLAAALQAGVQENDTIDGTLPCTVPIPDDSKAKPFTVSEGVSKGVMPLDFMTWDSINCAFTRLEEIVGLNRVVDTAHRMGVQSNIQPIAAFSVGSNAISMVDMATAGATISDQGVRHDAYYIEKIEGPNGQVIYQHSDPGTQALPTGVALREVDMLKGVIQHGTVEAREQRLSTPVSGKTGTYTANTNATFVGFSTDISAAVWLGNPLASGTDSMRGIPQFVQAGVSQVHGGNLPYRIWEAFMAQATIGQPNADWPPPPPDARRSLRLYLPGVECVYRSVTISDPNATADPSGTNADGSPATTPPPQIAYTRVGSDTTIPSSQLDPTAPVGAYAPAGAAVASCAGGPPVPARPKPSVTSSSSSSSTPGSTPPSSETTGAPTTQSTNPPTSRPTNPPTTHRKKKP
jgi:penicillin-binding protein 1A